MYPGKNNGKIIALSISCVILAIITILLVVVMIINNRKPIYEERSMSSEISAKVYVWLAQIENTQLTYDEVKECIGECSVVVIKTKKGRDEFEYKLEEGTYDECARMAFEGLERAYKLAVTKRLQASGYEGEITDTLVDELMKDSYGVSVREYLEEQNVALLPDESQIIR